MMLYKCMKSGKPHKINRIYMDEIFSNREWKWQYPFSNSKQQSFR